MNGTARIFLVAGSISGLLAVAFGAFGSHALEGTLPADLLSVFETGNRYHFYHSFALLASGFASMLRNNRYAATSGWCFIVGIVIFSGSLYVLALTGIRVLGAITPIGGILFIAGWASLAASAWTSAGSPEANTGEH